MIKCLECGFTAPRLQWTHFKFKCTGKFKNGREYLKQYPNAKLVSDELRKKTAVTLNNLIAKYGDEEGKNRWESYRKKQADSNSYDYKKEKHGWSREQFDMYNSSRSQTLEKMIARYGEDEGTTRWISYCERQAYTNTKDYFITKYGEEMGSKKYAEINLKKHETHDPKTISERYNISLDDAVKVIIQRRDRKFSASLREIEFTKMIESQIGRLENTSLNNPFGKWSHELNSYVVYDIQHRNCIIEFNGDYWHANPKIYAKTAIIRNKSVLDIWKRDMLKLETACKLGFKVLVVWEFDFMHNKVETINRVIEWILKEQK